MRIKYFLLGILAGMLLHKAVNFYYDYSFNEAFDSQECGKITADGMDLSERFKCTYKVMGFRNYLQYILIRPTAPNAFPSEGFWSI
jgi:hypothetical protein